MSGLDCALHDLGSMAGSGRDCLLRCSNRVFSPPDLLISTAISLSLSLSLQIKRPRRDTDHSSLSSAECNVVWSCIVTSQYLGAALKFKVDAFAVLTVVSEGWLKYLIRDNIILRPRVRCRRIWESTFKINIKNRFPPTSADWNQVAPSPGF